MPAPITFPWETAPETGQATEIADGVLWMRLPLPMALDHVNIYAFADDDGWTIIDTGLYSKSGVALWEALLDGPLGGRPIARVIITHHHPDHIGFAGWHVERGAQLITSRTSFLLARMLFLDEQTVHTPEARAFYWKNGMDADAYNERIGERPFNFSDILSPLPQGYTRLKDGDEIKFGNRNWHIKRGDGHAPEHLTFWSNDDDLVIGGDQLLATISPNIGVYPTEPEADPLNDWLESCTKFQPVAKDDHLVLPGHKLPFRGLPTRLQQLIENHDHALDRLREHLKTPRIGGDCFNPLFRRKIKSAEYGLAFVETVAHLNHLWLKGEVNRDLDDDGRYQWSLR